MPRVLDCAQEQRRRQRRPKAALTPEQQLPEGGHVAPLEQGPLPDPHAQPEVSQQPDPEVRAASLSGCRMEELSLLTGSQGSLVTVSEKLAACEAAGSP